LCQARPQRVKGRGGTDPTSCGPFASRIGLGERKSSSNDSDLRKSFWSVEGLNNVRTLLADCFSILLEGCKELKPRTRATINDHSLQEHHRWSSPQPAVAVARAVDHISQLAQVYAGQGKYKYVEAEPVYLQGLKVCQTVHGEFHADVTATLNNLRVIHRVYGQYCQGGTLAARALAIKEKLLGLDHPDVALSVVNLAQLRVVHPRAAGESGTAVPSNLGDSRAGTGVYHQRSRRRWRTLPMLCGK
jgi:hypothetical protein